MHRPRLICKEFDMNERSRAPPNVVDLRDAKEVTKGDPTPVHLEDNQHIMGGPEA
jgi:hypothetical protein